MKKHCTRIASLALVLALLISTMVPSFAAGAPVAWDDLPESSETAEDPIVLPDGDEETPAEEQDAEPADEETPAENPETAPVNDAPEEETPAEDVPEETETAQEMSDVVQEETALLAETDADGFTRGTEDGSDYWWKLDADGTLTIKGTKMADWTAGPPWYSRRYSIKKAVIEQGITNIGPSAFDMCYDLTEVTIPSSVTSIGVYAFISCRSLTEVTIPSGVTSIGAYTFYHCGSLKSITIPSGVTSIGDDAFSGCSSLTELTLPAGLTSIGSGTFASCSGLTTVTIPSGVTSIGTLAFSRCSGLTTVTIPSGVTSIGNDAFDFCSSLTTVTILDGVKIISDGVFNSCSNLTAVTIPASVMGIGRHAFGEIGEGSKVLFEGKAPIFEFSAFHKTIATVYYPQNDATWTDAVRQNYEGTLTWVAYDPANPPSLGSETPAEPEKSEDPEKPADTEPDTPSNWQSTPDGWQYLGTDGQPLTGSRWIEALGHRYVFDNNGSLQTGNATGDLLWEGNQYYLNPERDPNDPTTCYCVINYTRRREAGVTYYNQDGITYRGWVDGGNGKLLYQTVLRGKDGKELKDEAGFSTYIYVWGGQQIPEGRDPLDKEKTIAAGNYLFGEDGVLVTGRTGWYTIEGSAIAGEYYLTAADGHCALNTTQWDDAKGHRYLFGADGRKVSAGKDGRDVALTINGQYQTVYIAPDTDYVACNYYRPRKDSKGGDLGLTYYNPDGITYRGWVDGGNGKRLYQTVKDIAGVGELYFIVWRAQYLPEGKDPVTKDPIPAGWYLFGDDGVLITKDGTYTYPDQDGKPSVYEVEDGVIVTKDGAPIDGSATIGTYSIRNVPEPFAIEADINMTCTGDGCQAKLVLVTPTSGITFGPQFDTGAMYPYNNRNVLLVENIHHNFAGGQEYYRPGNGIDVPLGEPIHVMIGLNNDGSFRVYYNGEPVGEYVCPELAHQTVAVRVEVSGKHNGDTTDTTFSNIQIRMDGEVMRGFAWMPPETFVCCPTLEGEVLPDNTNRNVRFTGYLSGLAAGEDWDNAYDRVSALLQCYSHFYLS